MAKPPKTLQTIEDIFSTYAPAGVIGAPKLKFSTGIKLYDLALGGGFETGRIHELHGPTYAGKSELAYLVASLILHYGGEVCYINVNEPFNFSFAEKLGVGGPNFRLVFPNNLEGAQGIIEHYVMLRKDVSLPSLIVWDSVALSFSAEANDTAIGDTHSRTPEARSNARFFGRNWHTHFMGSKIIMIVINHERESQKLYGKPTTPGGSIFGYVSHSISRIRKDQDLLDSADNVIGHRVRIDITKHKGTGRSRTFYLSHYLDQGINNVMSTIHWAYDNLKPTAGRLEYEGKKWLKGDLYKYLCEADKNLAEFEAWFLPKWQAENP